MSCISAHLVLDAYMSPMDVRIGRKVAPTNQWQASLYLAHFPSEVIRNLTQYLHCCDILNLWQSGCARLRVLFSQQDGVQQLNLVTNAVRNLRIPALVYQLLGLEHLSIRLIVDSNVIISGIHLKALPKSLKSLDISMDDLYRVFMDPTPTNGSLNPMISLNEALPSLERLSLIGNLAPLAEIPEILFPATLTSLRLNSYRIANFDFDFSSLPPDLTSLQLEGVNHHTKATDWIGTKLPPNLRVYSGDIHVNSAQYELPSTLTHLNSSFSASNKSIPFPSLPESLEKVEFCLGYNMRFTERDAQNLPSKLTELLCHYMEDIPGEGIKHWSHRPLRKLVLPPGNHMTDELVERLPRTLTHLDMNYQANLSQGMIPLLPPRLEVLHISLLSLEPNSLASLPRSIRRLSLLYVAHSHAHLLPPSIETLKVMQADLCESVEEASGNGAHLGTPETAAVASIHSDETTSGNHRKWKSMAKGTRSKFPESLTSLQSDLATSFDAQCLPRALTFLDLGSVDILSDEDAVYFPPTLTELHLRGAFNISDFFFKGLSTPALRTFSCFTALAETPSVTDDTIGYLPTSITKLSLNMPSITGQSALLLPRHLKHLSLVRSINWRDENLLDLPPSLETLELPSCNFSHFCARLLPSQVRKFISAGHPKFTQIPGMRPAHLPIWFTDCQYIGK